MSYILEALRRSEMQRQQGRVPGLNEAPVSLGGHGTTRTGVSLRWVAAGGAGLAALVAAALAWWQPWQKAGPEPVVARAPAPAAVPAESPAAGAPGQAAPAPQVAARPPEPVPSEAARPAPVREAAAPEAPVARPPVRAAPAEPPSARAAAVAGKAAEPAPARAVAAPKPAAEPAAAVPARTQPAPAEQAEARAPAPPKRVLHYSELPPGVRQGVPKMAITGSSYTDEPELRMAVINERVVKEGEEAAPGVVLESIGADGIVLNYRGYRFRPAP